MKIYIKADGKRFLILLPTSMFLNRMTAAITVKCIKQRYPYMELSAEDFIRLVRVVKEYRRVHGRLELVSVISAEGDNVYISL